jgi:hypothetical protein
MDTILQKKEYSEGSPQRLGEELYWKYSEFENLTVDEVKRACKVALLLAMESSSTGMRLYYGEALRYIKERGTT